MKIGFYSSIFFLAICFHLGAMPEKNLPNSKKRFLDREDLLQTNQKKKAKRDEDRSAPPDDVIEICREELPVPQRSLSVHLKTEKSMNAIFELTNSGFTYFLPMLFPDFNSISQSIVFKIRACMAAAKDASISCQSKKIVEKHENQLLHKANQIIESGTFYQNSFLAEELIISKKLGEMREAGQSSKSPAVTTIQALMIRGPIFQRNIKSLLQAVENIRDLHFQCCEFALLKNNTPHNLWPITQAAYMQTLSLVNKAINNELLWAEKVKEKKFQEARDIKREPFYRQAKIRFAELLQSFYGGFYYSTFPTEDEAEAPIGRQVQHNISGKLFEAYLKASRAKECFELSNREGLTESAEKAFILAGNCYLVAAKLVVAGKREEATDSEQASVVATIAAFYFEKAMSTEISKSTRNAYQQAGEYYYCSAQLRVTEQIEKADSAYLAAETAKLAAERFINAADYLTIGEGEKREWCDRAGNSYLRSARYRIGGKMEMADQFFKEAIEWTPWEISAAEEGGLLEGTDSVD